MVLLLVAPGCALSHERSVTDAGPIRFDAFVPTPDAFVPTPDAFVPPDTFVPPDVGPLTSCTEFWSALPACPASPEQALGQLCILEGATCGVHCCEPGPPIVCRGGVWTPSELADDCRGVRCGPPHRCGTGSCAFGRVCVRSVGEVVGPSVERCVVPPVPIGSCEAAPAGSLVSEPHSCVTCTCDPSPTGEPIITLDCPCCDA